MQRMNPCRFLLVVLALFLGACSHKPIVPRTTFVTERDNKKTVLVQEGGSVSVDLDAPSNENFAWVLVSAPAEGLVSAGAPQRRVYTDALGSGNTMSFDFKAVKKGQYDLKFDYRSTESSEVKKSYKVTIDVRPSKDVWAER